MWSQVPFWNEVITAENITAKATEEIEIRVLLLFLHKFLQASFRNIMVLIYKIVNCTG
jgi:hypothetical protein